IRWQPEGRKVREQANRDFSVSNQGRENVSVSWEPIADMVETDEGYKITMELAGVPKEDVKLNIVENMLTIKGEKKNELKVPEKNFYRIERHFGNFQRTFHLNDNVDVNKIQATFKDGILTISLGKREETKPREISIQVK
ncbi:Hsp20/alpha crystallin family protein, partial [candidate division KSB1 bacterium]|nr:Hsp20/alpha crystallin family protein [candidate division KSB1 bacterium]